MALLPAQQRIVTLCEALLEAIAIAGHAGTNEGLLYSAVLDKFQLGEFEQAIEALVHAKAIERFGHKQVRANDRFVEIFRGAR